MNKLKQSCIHMIQKNNGRTTKILFTTTLFVLMVLVANVFLQVKSLKRYETPEESFKQSASSSAQLLDMIEQDNVSLIVYTESGNTVGRIIAKNEKGWDSFSKKHSLKKQTILENGTGYLQYRKIYGKSVLMICLSSSSKVEIQDNLDTPWQQTLVQDEVGGLIYALGVVDMGDMKSYKVYINGNEYSIP